MRVRYGVFKKYLAGIYTCLSLPPEFEISGGGKGKKYREMGVGCETVVNKKEAEKIGRKPESQYLCNPLKKNRIALQIVLGFMEGIL